VDVIDDSEKRTASLEPANGLMKWVREMRDVLQMTADLCEENARHRTFAETTQREFSKLCEEIERLRTQVEQAGRLAESAQRERDTLREEVAALRAESDRTSKEQAEAAEAAEAAANALGEMKILVNEMANKLAPRPSPFARDPKTPRS
jgi:predicted  nucleic acid-binding Zn-ribbon protein